MSMHITAAPGEIAERVVLVGDPERATMMAETYLKDKTLVNSQRGALCYTGTFEGVPVSVMAVGMGNPSMLIYATELCRDFGCKILVRAGTSGGYLPTMRKFDIVLSQATSTTSGINDNLFNGHFSPVADFGLLRAADDFAREMNLVTYVGNTVCNDRIYRDENYKSKMWAKYGILCSEMEGTALYTAAAEFGSRALMMVGITVGIAWDENGNETFEDLPTRDDHPGSVEQMVLLALRTAAHAQ